MNQPVHSIPTLHANSRRDHSMGFILQELGKLTSGEVEHVLRLQKELGARFGETAYRLGLISDEDIRQALAQQFGYPILSPGQGGYPEEMTAIYQPFGAQAEMLRAVRGELMLRWFDAGRRSLVVAGIGSGDGTSFFAANLAVVFSQLGKQTLLIDANLRQPRQHQIFKLKGRNGLSDMLVDRAGLETIARVEHFPDLSVLPCGTVPPNPQELVSHASFAELVETLASRFEIVLFDVSAFSTGVDAITVAARAGGALLVARKAHTRLADANAIGQRLCRNGSEVVGSVLLDF